MYIVYLTSAKLRRLKFDEMGFRPLTFGMQPAGFVTEVATRVLGPQRHIFHIFKPLVGWNSMSNPFQGCSACATAHDGVEPIVWREAGAIGRSFGIMPRDCQDGHRGKRNSATEVGLVEAHKTTHGGDQGRASTTRVRTKLMGSLRISWKISAQQALHLLPEAFLDVGVLDTRYHAKEFGQSEQRRRVL